MLRLFYIVECGIARFLCALCVYSKFGHHPQSSSPRLSLCQISFLSRPSLLSYPWKKSRRLLNHSPASLFDAPETEIRHYDDDDDANSWTKLLRALALAVWHMHAHFCLHVAVRACTRSKNTRRLDTRDTYVANSEYLLAMATTTLHACAAQLTWASDIDREPENVSH